MDFIENLRFYLLEPYGFEVSQFSQYDPISFEPFKDIWHPSCNRSQVFKLLSEHQQDINWSPYAEDTFPLIEKGLIRVFGKSFFEKHTLFPNYPLCFDELGKKRVLTIDFTNISGDEIQEYSRKFDKKFPKPIINKIREIKIIRILGTFKTCFTEGNKLVFETERAYKEVHNEALAFEMGLSFGIGGDNFMLEPITMSQEEFNALGLIEAEWGAIGGPRTKKLKK